jgi:hypothetical protein
VAGEFRLSIAVQTLIGETDPLFLDRWFDAILDALGGAGEVLEGWSIFAGDISRTSALDARSIGRYERLARAAGGDFFYISLDPGVSYWEGHRLLFEQGVEGLTLVLDPDTIILASTILRMAHSLTPDVGAVNARRIPLDTSTEQSAALVEMIETGGRCTLLWRHPSNDADAGPNAIAKEQEMAVPTNVWPDDLLQVQCPQAVAFSPSNAPVVSEVTLEHKSVRPAAGSLLEEVLNVAELGEARESVARALTSSNAPLLSIVMRTQVLRPEALREVLLCLAAQTDGRFELILVVHDGSLEHAALILDDQPSWLRLRTRILAASGGTRSHPLNIGIAATAGSLISFLDDDDLVFRHWVESFLTAAEQHPRRLIRTSAGVQRVTTILWPEGLEGHRNESDLSTPYPTTFNLADHLRVNMTPLMAFAFPRRFFDLFGGADESLAVCEDWDLALRAARVLGVIDSPVLTAIYRRWSSGGDSYSFHDQSIWERDMARVKEKLDAAPLVIPAGGASDLEQLSSQRGVPAQLAAAYGSASWRFTAPLRATLVLARTLWRQGHSRMRSSDQ